MSVSLREIRASPDALFEGFHLDLSDVRNFGFREALVSCGERLHPINRKILQSRGDLTQLPASECDFMIREGDAQRFGSSRALMMCGDQM